MKILVMRFSSIGDIVLCSPVFRVLSKKFPQAKIHFLTKEPFKKLVAGLPDVHAIYAWENAAEMKEIYATDYDLVVDLHQNTRSLIVKLRLWSVPSLTFSKENLKKLLFTLTKNKRFAVKPIVERYMETLSALGVVYDGRGLDFPLNETSKALPFDGQYGVVVLGGTYVTKRIPQEKLEEFFAINATKKWVLIGGKDELPIGKALEAKFCHGVKSLAGELSIDESAFVLSNAAVVLSGDTGMAHIAAALGKPVGVVWGNTSPGYGMSPEPKYVGQIEAFTPENLPCWPCNKLGYGACPKSHFSCMQTQKTEQWKNFTEKYL